MVVQGNSFVVKLSIFATSELQNNFGSEGNETPVTEFGGDDEAKARMALAPQPQPLNVILANEPLTCCVVLVRGSFFIGKHGVDPMVINEYRLHAAECLRIADDVTTNAQNRMLLIAMAQAWLKLARMIEADLSAGLSSLPDAVLANKPGRV